MGDPHGVHPTRFERLASDVWQVDGQATGVELLRNDTDGRTYLAALILFILSSFKVHFS